MMDWIFDLMGFDPMGGISSYSYGGIATGLAICITAHLAPASASVAAVLLLSPAVAGARTSATSAAASSSSMALYDSDLIARLLTHSSKADAISTLRKLLLTASTPTTDWSNIARKIYKLADPSMGTTGEFDHAFGPASALELAGHLDDLECSKILWVGCGHAPEAIIWMLRRATAGDAVEITALEKTQAAVERAHILLRRVYMAYHGRDAAAAATLDLNEPVQFGRSSISITYADMFEYASTAPSGTFASYDAIYSAAGRDASDPFGMPLSLLLAAIASTLTTGLLLMYESMWGKKGTRAPRPDSMPSDFVGQLEGSNETRHVRAHILAERPMFVQPTTSSYRGNMVAEGWRRSPVRNLPDGTRVAVYWASENLYYPGFITRHTMLDNCDIGILYDDANVSQPEQLEPSEVILIYINEDEDAWADLETGGDFDDAASSSLGLAPYLEGLEERLQEVEDQHDPFPESPLLHGPVSASASATATILRAARSTGRTGGPLAWQRLRSHQNVVDAIADGTLVLPEGIAFERRRHKPFTAHIAVHQGIHRSRHDTLDEAVAARASALEALPGGVDLTERLARIRQADAEITALRESSTDARSMDQLPRFYQGLALHMSTDHRSKLGYTGVSKTTAPGEVSRYRAKIGTHAIGTYDTCLDAAAAYARHRLETDDLVSPWAQDRRRYQAGVAAGTQVVPRPLPAPVYSMRDPKHARTVGPSQSREQATAILQSYNSALPRADQARLDADSPNAVDSSGRKRRLFPTCADRRAKCLGTQPIGASKSYASTSRSPSARTSGTIATAPSVQPLPPPLAHVPPLMPVSTAVAAATDPPRPQRPAARRAAARFAALEDESDEESDEDSTARSRQSRAVRMRMRQPHEPLVPYERQRQQNMNENANKLRALGLDGPYRPRPPSPPSSPPSSPPPTLAGRVCSVFALRFCVWSSLLQMVCSASPPTSRRSEGDVAELSPTTPVDTQAAPFVILLMLALAVCAYRRSSSEGEMPAATAATQTDDATQTTASTQTKTAASSSIGSQTNVV